MVHEYRDVNGSPAPPLIQEPLLAVTFSIAGQLYSIAVALVYEIVSIPALLPVGGAPPYLPGMLNLRGLFLPVLDGRVLVDAPAPLELRNQVIILGSTAPEFGLLVDQAHVVHPATPTPSTTMPYCSALPLWDHMLTLGDQAAFHIDLDRLRTLLP
jgi:purine-binding chemotaxis protein CheW